MPASFAPRRSKRRSKKLADVNPVYEGGADYEYDDMGNYNNDDDDKGNYDKIEVSTRKREVKAEVVDRSSIYGEKEEGWEDAVVVDSNPDYED